MNVVTILHTDRPSPLSIRIIRLLGLIFPCFSFFIIRKVILNFGIVLQQRMLGLLHLGGSFTGYYWDIHWYTAPRTNLILELQQRYQPIENLMLCNFNYWYGIGLLLVFLLVNQVKVDYMSKYTIDGRNSISTTNKIIGKSLKRYMSR